MIQLHATRKLFERLPLDAQGCLPSTPRSEWLFQAEPVEANPLSGWHGNLITLQRRNCVLLVHDETRFPLILPALTKPDFTVLNDRFVDALMNTLLKCGADDRQLDAAHRHLRPLQVDTHCNRSPQGTLNQMKKEWEYQLYDTQQNVAELTGYPTAAWLAGIPRGIKSGDYRFPKKAMLALVERLATTLETKDGG